VEEEKEAEIVGNENMKGFLSIKKENIDSNEDKGIGSLLTGGRSHWKTRRQLSERKALL